MAKDGVAQFDLKILLWWNLGMITRFFSLSLGKNQSAPNSELFSHFILP